MKILDHDSKLMQSFRLLFDYIGVNIVFVICCIPVFTIGAAQSALYTAIRAMQRNEPWLRLFFRAFKLSFKSVTVVWVICLPVIYIFSSVIMLLATTELPGSTPALVCASIVMGLLMCITATSSLLHSRFDFTTKELFRNSLVMLLAAPFQVVIGCAAMWAPAFVFFLVPWLFVEMSMWFFVIFYSVAAVLFARLMRYPIGRLADEIPERPDSYLIREAKRRAGKLKEE